MVPIDGYIYIYSYRLYMSLRSFEYRNVLLSDCRYQNVSGSSKNWFHILTGPMFIARPRNWTANLEQSRRLFENSQRRVPKHGQTPTILCDSMSLIWDQIFWPSDHWFPEQKWHLYDICWDDIGSLDPHHQGEVGGLSHVGMVLTINLHLWFSNGLVWFAEAT